MTPSVIISGMPPDVGRDDRARQRHRLEDRQALGLAIGRQDGDIERRGHGRDVVAPAGEDDPMGDPQVARLRLERLSARALADDQEIRVGDRSQDRRPRLEQRRVALLGLSRATTPTICEPGSIPYSSGSVQHGSWWS